MLYVINLKNNKKGGFRCQTHLQAIDVKGLTAKEDDDDDEKFYDEVFKKLKIAAEEELERSLTRDEEIYFKFDILGNLENYLFLMEEDEEEDEDEFYEVKSDFEKYDDDFKIGTEPTANVEKVVPLEEPSVFKKNDPPGSPDSYDDLYQLDPSHPLHPLNLKKPLEISDIIDFNIPQVATVEMAFAPYTPITNPTNPIRDREELIFPFRMENAWLYSGCFYDQTLLDEPRKYTQLGLLTEAELENLREYVTVRRYRTFNEAKSQGVMNSVYLTLIPCDPTRTVSPYKDSYKTSIPYAHRLNFEYIRNVVKTWTWAFEVNGDVYHYKVAPDSVSEKNTRKSRKR
jgi:hypothetical protein